jgi:hypothetical protein
MAASVDVDRITITSTEVGFREVGEKKGTWLLHFVLQWAKKKANQIRLTSSKP